MNILKANRYYAVIIAVFAFLLYINTVGNDFAWDDKIVILENERVQEGISGIPDLFRKYNSDLLQDKYGYRPVTLTSFAVEYSLFALNPAGYHFMSVLYFTLLCLVIFVVMRTLFESLNPVLPFLITMIFAAHPIHAEVVANVKSRDEIFAMLFGLLSLYQFLKAYQSGKWIRVAAGILFFLLAFLSRENAITFLAIIPLALLIYKKPDRKAIFSAIAILPVLGILCLLILRYSTQSNLGAEATSGFGVFQESHILGNSFFYTNDPGRKVANALHLTALYSGKFLFPYPLTYYSGSNMISEWGRIPHIIVGISTIALIVLSVLRFRKMPLFTFGFFLFGISLSVYLHIFQTLSDTMADRFLFIPSLGLTMMLVYLIDLLIRRFSGNKDYQRVKELPVMVKGGLWSVLAVLSAMTILRNQVWHDDFTLVSHDMPYLENCARAHYYYATELNQKIREEGFAPELETEMIQHYIKASGLSDSIYYGRLELAGYYCDQKAFDKGIPIYREMTKLFPKASDPEHYLGQAYFEQELYSDAIPHLKRSIELAPKSHDSYYYLAIAYGKTGQGDKGVKTALKGMEDYPQAEVNMHEALGHIYYDMGDMDKSIASTLKLIDFGRKPYDVYATIIGRFQAKGDTANALKYYQIAIEKGIMQPVTPPQ